MNTYQASVMGTSDDDLPVYERKPRANPVYKGRSKFSPQEDQELMALVEEYGTDNWIFIAEHMPNRNSRQCRERYLNYLNPKRNTSPWTEEEDRLLEEKHAKMGPRWVHMVRYFPNRTDVMIKNRYMMLQRRSRKEAKNVMTATSESDTSPVLDFDDITLFEELDLFSWSGM